MPKTTQQILEDAYTRVIAKIQETIVGVVKKSDEEVRTLQRLANLFGISTSLPPLSSDEQELVQRVAWYPVAQKCVVTVLRLMLGEAEKRSKGLHPKWLEKELRLREAIKLDEFARTLGLDSTIAYLALEATRAVFLKSDLFAYPVHLEMDGKTFEVFHREGGIVACPVRKQER